VIRGVLPKRFLALLAVFAWSSLQAQEALESAYGQAQRVTKLSDFRWQQRLLVINEPSNAEQLSRIFAVNAPAFDERRLLWFMIVGQTLRSNYPGVLDDALRERIQAQLSAKPGESILIGLDGGVKARKSQLDLPSLYALIDAMPMRRTELRD